MTNIFVDSGAPTLYNTMFRKNKGSGAMGASMQDRQDDDFSFIKTEEYKKYRRDFLDFVKENKDHISVFANLDIINNAEETYKNQKFFEKQGLNPLPVFHFGSDPKWLKRYIDEGYGYICIGGLIPNPFTVLKKPLDELWSRYLTDDKGFPKVKVHGFAVTSPRLVHRYPWYSTDSTTWVKMSRCGLMLMPRVKDGKWDYTRTPITIFITERSPTKCKDDGQHIDTISRFEREKVIEYIRSKGFELGKSRIYKKELTHVLAEDEIRIKKGTDHIMVEQIIEKGVCNNNIMRDTINAMYFMDMAASLPKWPWAMKKQKKGFF